ncbi:CCA tRNA nucleotidyltransferase [Lacipirellula limnantheis]|uniref:tRNA nucleotidyltransferase/poly(A) polymerase n=1 Tax=Lacipirellula limnantheis TaxID=2528024 RepID=A0A517U0I2_9BACT|nr:CCA tRNA nucleotidyltransferase [Lacipirellula limnantheis]QDT74132.1 tRNA nucleotidyltransferase/poly(A) polymerase [Lacipirellula limnantheis]
MEGQITQREFALDVVRQLRSAGHEALWAGGCVRDQLLGLAPKDYDVATSARPEEVRELFGTRRTLAIGAAFGVIAVLARKPLHPIDVATFRSDGDYLDGRRPASVAYTDARHDAERRDFTINGLFFDPVSEDVVDYVGGVADLEARVLRAIGEPLKRFSEDKLRLLRAVRFAATYDLTLDPATFRAVQAMAGDVGQVSGERIGAELRRIIVHRSRSRGAALLAATGLASPLLPEVAPHAVANDERWLAALTRLEQLADATVPLGLAALLFGMVDPGEVRQLGQRLRLSNKEVDRTMWLLEHLPAMLDAASLPWPRLQRLLVHEGRDELLALQASILPAYDPGLARCREQLALPSEELNPPPLVTGDDLLRHGVRAGRQFSQLLEYLRDRQLDGALLTAEDALWAAQRWMAEHPAVR